MDSPSSGGSPLRRLVGWGNGNPSMDSELALIYLSIVFVFAGAAFFVCYSAAYDYRHRQRKDTYDKQT